MAFSKLFFLEYPISSPTLNFIRSTLKVRNQGTDRSPTLQPNRYRIQFLSSKYIQMVYIPSIPKISYSWKQNPKPGTISQRFLRNCNWISFPGIRFGDRPKMMPIWAKRRLVWQSWLNKDPVVNWPFTDHGSSEAILGLYRPYCIDYTV